MKAIDSMFAVMFTFIGFSLIVCGLFQAAGVIPQFNAWSDLLAMFVGIGFLCLVWAIRAERARRELEYRIGVWTIQQIGNHLSNRK
jgi:uncharacterized membrane protein